MEITRLLNRLQCCPLPSSWWKKLDPPLKTKLPFLWDGIAVSLKWNSFLEKLTWIDPHILWNRVQCLSDQYPEKLINKTFACIFLCLELKTPNWQTLVLVWQLFSALHNFWTSQIKPVWCPLSRYGGLTTLFSHFLRIQKIITPSLFFLQALFKVQWNQVGYFLYQVLIVLKPKLGRSILCSIFCCSYADDWWILWMPESCLVVVILVSSMMF